MKSFYDHASEGQKAAVAAVTILTPVWNHPEAAYISAMDKVKNFTKITNGYVLEWRVLRNVGG